MKKTLLSLGLIAIAIMVGLSACNKDGGPWGPGEDGMLMVSEILPDEYIPAFDAAEFTVEGEIEADDIEVYPEFNGNRDDKGNKDDRGWGNMRDKMKKRMGPGFELRQLFWMLKLDREQAGDVYVFIQEYHDCIHSIMVTTQEERQAIMENARAARLEIMTQFREDGDREAAKTALRALYEQVKSDLDALVDHDAICECYKTLLDKIRSILTDEQIVILERWIANSKNPCLDEGE